MHLHTAMIVIATNRKIIVDDARCTNGKIHSILTEDIKSIFLSLRLPQYLGPYVFPQVLEDTL